MCICDVTDNVNEKRESWIYRYLHYILVTDVHGIINITLVLVTEIHGIATYFVTDVRQRVSECIHHAG